MVVAAGLAVARRGRRPPAAALPVAAGTFVVGALPWLWTNARTGLASLRSASSPTYQASTYGGRLHLFLDESLPMMLGLRVPVTGVARWPGREVHVGCCVATLALSRVRRAPRGADPGCAPAVPLPTRGGIGRSALLPAGALALVAVMVASTALAIDDQSLGGHPTAFWRQTDHPNAVATQAATALRRAGYG